MMGFVPLMLMAVAATVTLADFEHLTPQAAGNIVLAEQDHAPIVAIERTPAGGLTPPNTLQFWLFERPVISDAGCTRKRWYVEFRHPPGTPQGDAVVTSTGSGTEIALASGGTCPSGQYVRINFNLDHESAFAGLALLQQIRSGRREYTYTCSDQTSSNLCSSKDMVARELSRVEPWLVQIGRGALRFTLGREGVVTHVYVQPAEPDHIAVERLIPPPA